MLRRDERQHRRYLRAARRAFAQVTFYREQCAAAGQLLDEPAPTAVAQLPDPPHTLCPFSRPWVAEREPSLWTPPAHPLARALRTAGCRDGDPVLEIRAALLDRTRLPRLRRFGPRPPYRVLLSPEAVVASETRRAALNREALAVVEAAGAGTVVGGPDELDAVPGAADPRLRPVRRLPVAAAAEGAEGAEGAERGAGGPAVLFEPRLGYLGGWMPECGLPHLDTPRVYARDRDGVVAFSLPRSRRPTLLDIVPAGAEAVTVGDCPRHGTPVLLARAADG